MTPQISRLQAYVTSSQQNPTLGTLPPNSYVLRAHLHVITNFDSDGTDNIQCGYDADQDFIFANIDVSSTGVKSVTLGSGAGYNSVARKIEGYYTNGGTEPSQGNAFILIEYMVVPKT